MAAGSKVVPLPGRRVKPAAAPARAPRKAAAKKPTRRTNPPAVKVSGFAVGVSKANYEWITATASALGTSRQAVADAIVGKLLQRATLGSLKNRRKR